MKNKEEIFNKVDFESLNNLMKKIINRNSFDKFDIEQARIFLAKIKFSNAKNVN